MTTEATGALPCRELDFDDACTAGRPRASDLNNRVRNMYSLLHDASVLRREKYRRSDFDECVTTDSFDFEVVLIGTSDPGK